MEVNSISSMFTPNDIPLINRADTSSASETSWNVYSNSPGALKPGSDVAIHWLDTVPLLSTLLTSQLLKPCSPFSLPLSFTQIACPS